MKQTQMNSNGEHDNALADEVLRCIQEGGIMFVHWFMMGQAALAESIARTREADTAGKQ